jgi:hypothetical protein
VHVPLVVRIKQNVVFKLWDAYMPEVEVLSKVLKHLRFNSDLGLLEGYHLL